ncbi:hypothetical protein XENOCAPTIV_017249 [Xenoophorus captivus]|uniref:Uncharacterized protein n=1 Tax=Xenoophorus captivus TaxID=1517983 RepID=A0ABV0R130_9TELE
MGQELPCNNYGVKWQLATQEGICLLAARFPLWRGHRSETFQEKSISQAPRNRWRPGLHCLLKQHKENGKHHANLEGPTARAEKGGTAFSDSSWSRCTALRPKGKVSLTDQGRTAGGLFSLPPAKTAAVDMPNVPAVVVDFCSAA